MKIIIALFCIILTFGCGKNDSKVETISKPNKVHKDHITSKIETTKLDTNQVIQGHYLTIGYFDESNKLYKVEQFFNGVLKK